MIYLDDSGEVVPLQENELPLVLPDLDDFNPTGTGEPPLAKATSWVCLNNITNISIHLDKIATCFLMFSWLILPCPCR